ncbi:MAG: FixH family protein [Pseudobdellovibrio sp.]
MRYLILFLFLVACAKPNYQEAAPVTVENQKAENCNLFLSVKRLCTTFEWESAPNVTTPGSFLFKFYVQETPTVFSDPTETVFVQLWMPSMGHGSTPVTVEKIKAGEYRASDVFFIMPGEWEIRIQLKDAQNVVDQVVKKITL